MITFINATDVPDSIAMPAAVQLVEAGVYGSATITMSETNYFIEYSPAPIGSPSDELTFEEE